MSDGDDAEATEDGEDLPDADTLDARLDDAAEALAAAETEADLDDVEGSLDSVAEDLEAADLPEPDDEDEAAPAEAVESRLAELREELDAARGPYAGDVAADVRDAAGTIEDTRWTEAGEATLVDVAGDALEALSEQVEAVDAGLDASDPAALGERLDAAAEAVESSGLDPDEDAAALEALVAAAEDLATGVEDAESWDDLSVREKLQAEGFYDVLGQKHKDFPPEWSALKQWEQRDDPEMALTLLDRMGGSEFIERHVLESLERMGHPDSTEAMLERAEKRDKPAIRVLGKIGEADDAVLETLHEYVDADAELARTTMTALGEIGSPESVAPVAQNLAADDAAVRSTAARTLGLLGDTRAVEPLADVLETDEDDTVRASAAWALVQVGTEAALEAAADHADDQSYLVESEARRAEAALGEAAPA